MKRDTMLIIDDMEVNRLVLREIFKDSYNILEAEDGKQAFDILMEEHEHIAAILLDLEMPVMNGFEFLEATYLLPESTSIPIMIITVDDTNSAELRAFDYGVADVIKKPFNPRIISKRVKNVISLNEYQTRLETMLEAKTAELKEQEKSLAETNERLIEALSAVVEFRDLETGGHIHRIKSYTRVICDEMVKRYQNCGLDDKKINLIVSASAMHDIGKIAIPDSILLKPGRLTPEEFEVMKTHTTKGAEIITKVGMFRQGGYLDYCCNICLYHHEKYDGRGYPKGLSGDEIPVEAQIVSIADVFDALVNKRVYKDAYTVAESYRMIKDGECGQFSNRVMECFGAGFERFKQILEESRIGNSTKNEDLA